jgi:hypothetical protein
VVNVQAAGWFPDPMQRHQFRWWTGAGWSEHVSDGGTSGIDPLANQAPAQPTVATQAPPLERSVPYPPQTTYPAQQPYGQQPYGQQPPRQTLIGPPPVSGVAASATAVGWITLAGAVVAAVGALLNWLDAGFSTANGLDVPVAFLVDYKTISDSSFSVGIIIFVLAASALGSAFVRQPAMRAVARVTGALLMLVGLVYVVQLYRLADEVGFSISDMVGIGPFAVVAGGLTVLVAAGR